MGKGFLIDTNTAIDYFGNLLPANAVKLIQSAEWQISIIKRIEMLVLPKLSTDETYELLAFLNNCFIHNISEDIVFQTIEVRKNFHVKHPDAIIAAMALVNNLSLISRNTDDFIKVDGLQGYQSSFIIDA